MRVENSWANANFADVTPKNFDPELFPDPVKKEKPNLDERQPRKRRTTPQNLGLVIMASRTGALLDLPPEQRGILTKRYLSENPRSFRDLAKRLRITRQRAGQIEQDALKKLIPR